MNLLEAEALIIARLKAQIAGVRIGSIASVAGTLDITAQCPALFLAPGEAEVAAAEDDSYAQHETATWEIIACVKLIPDPTNLGATLDAAGALLGQAADALVGWTPSSAYRPMRYAGREKPEILAGHGEFPIRFTLTRPRAGAVT